MPQPFFAKFPHLQALFGGDPPLAELGPGRPREDMRPQLAALDEAALFGGAKVTDQALARCCRSGLWLAYDFLDESHAISQEIHGPEGSYWHGIMHRREPDYSNAKYWFRHVGQHPVLDSLRIAADQLLQQWPTSDPAAAFLASGRAWDPLAFIDLCEAIARGRATCERLAREIALAEWRLLFAHCYEGAVAS